MKTDFKKVTGIGKETKKTLQENIQNLIHPWQYKDSEIHIVNIDSDISDVESNWNEEIRFRQEFKINDDGSLNIPTVFVQINGIYSNKANYRAFIEKMNTPNSVRYKTTNNLFGWHQKLQLKEARKFCKNNEFLAFQKLNSSMQKMINKKLLEFIDKYDGEIDCLEEVLGTIYFMNDEKIISLLQNFDYCFNNPKIIVENMDDKNFEDVAKYILLFFYSIGFDIMIFSPKGSPFLKGIEINEITLEKYLSPTEEVYDYRDDEEIKKAKKEEKKEQKKRHRENTKYERARKRKSIFLGLLSFVGVLSLIGLMIYAIFSEVSEENNYQEITESMDWEEIPTIMYINCDDTPAYVYASEETEQNCTYNKDEEVNVLHISSDWVEVAKSSSSVVYIKKENVREKLYDIDVSNFSMKIKIGAEVNAYTFPDTKSEVLHVFDYEDTITATGYNSDWYQIDYNSKKGFVNRDELTVYEEQDENVQDVEKTSKSEQNEEIETKEQENAEEVLDGEIVEDTEDVNIISLIAVAIVIFLILFVIFYVIMLF